MAGGKRGTGGGRGKDPPLAASQPPGCPPRTPEQNTPAPAPERRKALPTGKKETDPHLLRGVRRGEAEPKRGEGTERRPFGSFRQRRGRPREQHNGRGRLARANGCGAPSPPPPPGFLRGRRGLGPGPVLRGGETPDRGDPGPGKGVGCSPVPPPPERGSGASLWKAPAMAKGGGAALWYLEAGPVPSSGNNRPAGTAVIVCASKTALGCRAAC
ncbi:WAS/WASL-interacting protein family member 2-like [Harpia harpyja]|uniref:WAS/WASL-interacting protein family member 2-like n=1 Tax=Harpia harpyja TaxID=202280 RepID=UPI0022B13188|nr:WAS/WASL-interacting protein family member 2-like [Harpia harpyja]